MYREAIEKSFFKVTLLTHDSGSVYHKKKLKKTLSSILIGFASCWNAYLIAIIKIIFDSSFCMIKQFMMQYLTNSVYYFIQRLAARLCLYKSVI